MTFEYTYKNIKIIVTVGDITQQKVDAIVNPANSLLIMGGGVAGAIKRAGGEEIEREARQHAPVSVGKAVATTAGKLKAKYVIHSPTMQKPAMVIGEENVKLAMKGALDCAERIKIQSLAFPGLGTGVGGFSLEKAANIMISVLKEHIDRGTKLKEIIFVGFKNDLATAFKNAIDKILT
ncbi:MAG: macro domain-containing protein [Candidatus Bathyarchaeia archaeon]|jgi:O-acetyl-ADP-ribose deacetylase (regulator of RNase III)|nr:macro domain-containing protein [Candidatus Bathyarchaeota archaeon A05DMB-4]MDH7595840.1 macro domain-containing protein [Candidatus Bathyarchaeota archaeon]